MKKLIMLSLGLAFGMSLISGNAYARDRDNCSKDRGNHSGWDRGRGNPHNTDWREEQRRREWERERRERERLAARWREIQRERERRERQRDRDRDCRDDNSRNRRW